MTEQFSQEYIAYIRKDKVLQKLWCSDSYTVGDQVLVDGRVGTVAALDTRDYFADEGVRYFAISFEYPNRRALGSPEWEVWERHSLTWLPALFQLIGVIEGAGWRWYKRSDGIWGIVNDENGEGYRVEGAKYRTDLMLAAAQLAVRAVEGK